MYFSIEYILLIIVTIAIGGATQLYIKSTFSKYSSVPSQSGLTGAQVAQRILEANGIAAGVGQESGEGACIVAPVAGNLTDHYDPRSGVVALSDPVYGESSISAIAVAAHEVGHAIQDAKNYTWGEIRTAIVPIVNFGSSAAGILIFAGFIINFTGLIWLGILGYSLAVGFQIVTLPVELNASKRALVQLESLGILAPAEVPGARQVLTSAALTYVAAALISVLNLLYYIGLASNRD